MLGSQVVRSASLLAGLAVSVVGADLPAISVIGSKFFDSNGDQFFVKGISYQLTEADPLIDTAQCTLDATLMQTLGANAIRVYHVDPTADHSGCMSAFAAVGIYLFLDLDTFTTAINPGGAMWTSTQFSAFSAVMDSFHNYTNTLGFFVGNEVVATDTQSEAAPYIKAAARDMKAYRDSKSYRPIPVGYSAADIAELRPMLQNYLVCGPTEADDIDFFGLNSYEWCGDSSFNVSGYNTLNDQATTYTKPIFFSETGCIKPPPRTFADQSAILGPDMNEVWSGAIVYEWIYEANSYGLISYGPTVAATATGANIQGGFTRAGTPLPVTPDFSNLQAQWATLTPTGVKSADYTPATATPACPASTAGGWLVNGNDALPTLNQAIPSGGAVTTTAGAASGTPTGSAASPSSTTKGSSASGGKEIAGMSAGLVAVMLGFVYWL